MQDFDTLRSRVEATARKLTSVQTERHDQVQSLVEILRQLEERHAAQEQQLAYYRARFVPLEEANQQLVHLVEHLLELIDRGFGEESLGPLRNAAQMASAMLANDLLIAERGGTAHAEGGSGPLPLPDFGTEDEATVPAFAFSDDDESGQDDDPAEPEYAAGTVDDLQMEEDALISLDEMLEVASTEGEPVPLCDAAAFEDVSEAELRHEAQEEAAAGLDHLPGIVRQAVAAADSGASVPHTSEVEALSAIAEALEAETEAGTAPVPAPSDIRALLMRVEALARKAEAMRLAQGGETGASAKPANATTGKSDTGKTAAA